MNEIRACLPSKPEYLSSEEYEAICSAHQCENFLNGTCKKICETIDKNNEYPVDFDHIIPRSRGGDDTPDNVKLLCSNKNRSKKNNDDPYYGKHYFFDQIMDREKLRKPQQQAVDLVFTAYKELFLHPSKYKTYNCFMLLALIVGAGKTITLLAILCAINELRNKEKPNSKRVTGVLYLVHQTPLVDSLAVEIENDFTGYGIVKLPPRVGRIKKASDWEKAKYQDVVVACPQALWEEESDRRVLTSEKIAEILKRFEVIVIDEGHFAVDKYIDIFHKAPLAYKFVMTATPFDGEGKFLSQQVDKNGVSYGDKFRLFMTYGYQEAHQDGYLKTIEDVFIKDDKGELTLNTNYYINIRGGENETYQNGEIQEHEHNSCEKLNHYRENALLHVTCKTLHKIAKKENYPAHGMIRCEGIDRAIFISKTLNENPRDYDYVHKGKSMQVLPIFSGVEKKILKRIGRKDTPELRISKNHPWMMAKEQDKVGDLLIVTVDMLQFGINNPYCALTAFESTKLSLIDIVQRAFGRSLRVAPHKGITSENKVYCLWIDKGQKFEEILDAAVRYIKNMEEEVTNNFIPLSIDINDTKLLAKSDLDTLGIPSFVKLQTAYLVGKDCEQQGISVKDIDTQQWVDQNQNHIAFQGDSQKIADFVEKLKDESYKDRYYYLPPSQYKEGVTIVLSETAKNPEDFTVSELINFYVEQHGHNKEIIDALQRNDKIAIEIVRGFAKKEHDKYHHKNMVYDHPRSILGICTKGEKISNLDNNLASEIQSDFLKSRVVSGIDLHGTKLRGIINKNINIAAANVFGMDKFTSLDILPIEAQLSSALHSPYIRLRVKRESERLIMRELQQSVPAFKCVFDNQINYDYKGESIDG